MLMALVNLPSMNSRYTNAAIYCLQSFGDAGGASELAGDASGAGGADRCAGGASGAGVADQYAGCAGRNCDGRDVNAVTIATLRLS